VCKGAQAEVPSAKRVWPAQEVQFLSAVLNKEVHMNDIHPDWEESEKVPYPLRPKPVEVDEDNEYEDLEEFQPTPIELPQEDLEAEEEE